MCKTFIKDQDSKYYELATENITWKMGQPKSFKRRQKIKMYVCVCVCIHFIPTELH